MLRDEVLKYIEDTLGDISPDTVRIYKNKFDTMTDRELLNYLKTNKYPIRLYANDKDINPAKIDKLVKSLNIVTQERLYLPYKGEGIMSRSECMIIPVQMRRLQQITSKQNKSSFEVVQRDDMGQASGSDKTGRISDQEVNQLVGMGLDKVLTEFMSPRSDNMAAKRQMNEQLSRNLSFELDSITTKASDKSTLKYVDALYKCMNIATDFIDSIHDIS